MKEGISGKIHALEFGCQAPLKFYEHCSSCAKFEDSCPDLDLGKEILRGKKKIVYNGEHMGDGKVHAGSFKCYAPLYYFEKTRKTCGHKGRCREEGLLLALFSGKKQLDYSQKTAIEFPYQKGRRKEEKIEEPDQKIYILK